MFDVEKRFARPGHRNLAVVLKVAERCNLACTYCYFFFGSDDSYLKHPALVSPDTVADIARFLGESARRHRLERIELVLHGGEPLLLKPERTAALVEAVAAAMPTYCEVDFALQTNGVLIDKRWIDLFARYDIGVGVSLDGPRAVNDLARLDKRGASSFDDTVAGWRMLKQAAADGRIKEPGILSVFAPTTNADTLAFFIDELGAKKINFLLPDMFCDSAEVDAAAIERVGETMIAIFEEWRRRSDPDVHVRFVNDALLPMIASIPAESSHNFREDLWRAMTIASDGMIYVEDTVRGAFADRPEAILNVADSSATDVLSHPFWRTIAEAADKRPAACRECRYADVCQSGPLVSRYSHANGFDNPSLYCPALFAFHRHVEREVAATGRLLSARRHAPGAPTTVDKEAA